MAKITGYNRNSQQTITTLGGTFSIPPSEDFTDGTWNSNGSELCLSEIGINETDNKAYVRIGNNINQFSFVGGVNGNNLSQTLAIGNDSGANNIIMGTGTNIHTSQGTGGLSFDITGPQSVYLGDDMAATANYLWLRDGSFLRLRATNNPMELGAQSSTIGIGDDYDGIVLAPYTGLSTHIYYGGSEILSVTGSGIVMQSATVIKSSNGGGQIDLDAYGKAVSISTDNGALSKAYVYLEDAMLLLGVPNRNIYLGNNGIQIASPTASILISSGGYFGVNVNDRTFKFAMTANAAASTTTLASISMSDNQTLTIQVVLNAYCASPNRNLGITMMASFLKYGGTIYQTGTTNSIVKDGFGDGSTATIDTDGTNVRIRITNGSGLTTNWAASYDYLLT